MSQKEKKLPINHNEPIDLSRFIQPSYNDPSMPSTNRFDGLFKPDIFKPKIDPILMGKIQHVLATGQYSIFTNERFPNVTPSCNMCNNMPIYFMRDFFKHILEFHRAPIHVAMMHFKNVINQALQT